MNEIEKLLKAQEAEINRLRALFVEVETVIQNESIDRALPKDGVMQVMRIIVKSKNGG